MSLDKTATRAEPRFDKALAIAGVRLHLYEKHSARPGRKRSSIRCSKHTGGSS